MKTALTIPALNSFPPTCFGTIMYHETYAGSSQKYTIGCPVNQNRVRSSNGSVFWTQPRLQGSRNPEPKQLDEARGQITSDYQTYLEEQWIQSLKEKYPVEVNTELLSRIEE